jgi:NadR type nicotinamide-nucleotide adenylyltransferase
MEEGAKTCCMINGNIRKIVVTGPESTGKTALTEALAPLLNAVLIPEFARTYVENLHRSYDYFDLEIIARHQVEEEKRLSEISEDRILLMDTWLIITKVWFDVVFGKVPDWVDCYIASSQIDLFLVCQTDLPWVADPVRENGGKMRSILFERYCREIEHYGFKYEVVEGFGATRVRNALQLIKSHSLD